MKPREKEFCRQMTMTADPVRAARQAGYRCPEKSVPLLLGRDDIAEEIRRLSSNIRSICESTAVCGLYRLAYGGIGDALTLIYGEGITEEQLRKLDLSCVAEIKRTDKSVEVKFCDRIKAIDRLAGLFDARQERDSGGLLEAMALSAEALGRRIGADDGEV